MKQHELKKNVLILKVKKSPFLVRTFLFLFSFLFFFLPIFGLIISIISGSESHVGYLMLIGIFSLIGFYMLRLSLWNTYGSEIISFNNNIVTYVADYGWFKDGKKTIEINLMNFSIKNIGYEEDQKGTLIIGSEGSNIECVTKMPISELEEIIEKLN